VNSVSKRYFLFYRILTFLNRNTFSCQCTFINLQTCLLNNSSVCRNLITCFQNDDISYCYFSGRNLCHNPVTLYLCFRSGKLFQTVQRLFCFDSLYCSKDCINRDNDQNNDRTLRVTQKSRNNCRDNQNNYKEILVLFQKDHSNTFLFLFL